MRQTSLSPDGFKKHHKPTRREKFLAEMEARVPWGRLLKLIEPYYPKADPERGGRPTAGLERMLRIHFLQHWFGYSDPGMEDALYDMPVLRDFVGIDLSRESVPDETTICRFRHLLEKHGLGGAIFHCVNGYLEESGVKVSRGTIVDATVISAPTSTKNRERKRDSEMGSTCKGKKWDFGAKVHIGVDSQSKAIHSTLVTAANVHDSRATKSLLHGRESKVWGDSAYTGMKEAIRAAAPNARDYTNKRGARGRPLSGKERAANRTKSRVRAKVEHPFRILKNQFGFVKLRYKGLGKNANHVFTSLALVNIVMCMKLLAPDKMPSAVRVA